jgi:hypothetical protein
VEVLLKLFVSTSSRHARSWGLRHEYFIVAPFSYDLYDATGRPVVVVTRTYPLPSQPSHPPLLVGLVTVTAVATMPDPR